MECEEPEEPEKDSRSDSDGDGHIPKPVTAGGTRRSSQGTPASMITRACKTKQRATGAEQSTITAEAQAAAYEQTINQATREMREIAH